MIYDITLMQNGGFIPPFAYYLPVFADAASRRSASTSSSPTPASASTKKDLDTKDLMDMLGKIDGLPSDMNAVYSQLSKFFDALSLGVSVGSLSKLYLSAMQLLQVAKFNKKEYDNAYRLVVQNDGLNEIATTTGGLVVVADEKGKIGYISPETYLKNKDKYLAVTNAQLLDYRANQRPYDNSILQTVSNGIGLSLIDKLIHLYMENLGTSTTSISTVAQRKAEEMQLSLNAVRQASDNGEVIPERGVAGLYEISSITKTLAQQAERAIDYIIKLLPINARTILLVKAGDPDKMADYVLSVITDKVNQRRNETKEYSEKPIADPAKKGKSGSGGSGNDGADPTFLDLFLNIIQGEGGTTSIYLMLDKDGHLMNITGISYPNLTVNSSHPVPENGSLDALLFSYGFSGITKGSNAPITFGNQILDKSDYENIAYMNDGNAIRAIIPITHDPATGQEVPDLDFIENHKEIYKLLLLKKNNLQDPEVIKALVGAGIVDPYTGLPDMKRFKPYLLINGLGTSQEINASYVKELTGDKLDKYIDIFKRSVYLDKEHNAGLEKQYDFDTKNSLNPFDWFGNYDRLYMGTIFIPITLNVLLGKTAAGTNIKENRADEMQNTYNHGENMSNMNPTSSNLLGI